MFKLSFFNRLLFYFNILVAIALLVTCLTPVINPADFWFVALFGLGFTYIFLLNFFLALYWIWKKKAAVLIPLIAIFLSWGNFQKTFSFHLFSSTPEPSANQVKVMSYNVKNFDLYNWSTNRKSRDSMMNIISSIDPDIIFFQEFYSEDIRSFKNIEILINDLGFKDYYFEKTLSLGSGNHWGLATFSKYPILKKEKINFDNSKGNLATYCDLEIGSQIVRVFNAHLQSIKLGPDDYKFIKDLTDEQDFSTSKSVIKKLRNAFIKRSSQAKILAKSIRDAPYPTIIGADFNDTPVSYTYETIAGGLQDAFVEKGLGLGGTYAGPLPSFRIDYILTNDFFDIHDYQTIKKGKSDHFPIVSTVSF